MSFPAPITFQSAPAGIFFQRFAWLTPNACGEHSCGMDSEAESQFAEIGTMGGLDRATVSSGSNAIIGQFALQRLMSKIYLKENTNV